MRAMHLDARRCRAARRACAAATKASRMRFKPVRGRARAAAASPVLVRHVGRALGLPAAFGRAGSTARRPTARGSTPCGRHGRAASRSRIFECLRTAASTGFSAASVASLHRPEVSPA